MANWLLRLTNNYCKWALGLCYLYLRNVKRFDWNHKRVYRIDRQLELNRRIEFTTCQDSSGQPLTMRMTSPASSVDARAWMSPRCCCCRVLPLPSRPW